VGKSVTVQRYCTGVFRSTAVIEKLLSRGGFLTRLPGEAAGVSEVTFTPGDPTFVKFEVAFFF
jgi:hypothetical protein